jgi:hypothetical protein
LTNNPYNPLDKINLARSIEAELRAREVRPLGSTENIAGAGVYALYYRGAFPAYRAIAKANEETWELPIYVGKAIPKGGRKGGISRESATSGTALLGRLRKHAQSIKATDSLQIEDFSFRYVVLDDIWIPLGENILIETFQPLWNVALEGFGINDPGGGRSKQKRSPWDILHPGRSYAARLTGGGPELSAVIGRVEDHLHHRPLRALPKALAEIAQEATEEDRGEV